MGAILFGLGALTGVLVSAIFTDKLDGNPHFMLASHLNALMGCFWLICLGTTWKRLSMPVSQARLLLRTAVLAAYANWGVTLVKAMLDVQGIDFTGDVTNDTIFGVLTLSVVIPTFIASGLWIRGLWSQEAS